MNLRQQLAIDLSSRIPGCTVGLKFGHASLEVDDKIFAFTRPDESAALKLPAARIAELVAGGEGHQLRMGERTMREWVVIPNIAAPHHLRLLHEARAYVASLPRTERRRAPARTAKKAAKKRTRR